MQLMQFRQLMGLALLGVLALVIGHSAFAENGHAYNGSFCRAGIGNYAGNFTNETKVTNVASAASYHWVSCPIIVDEIADTRGTTRIWLHFTSGTQASSNALFQCWLHSMNGNGTPRQTRSNYRRGTGWLLMTNITSDDYWGSYALRCLLPGGYSSLDTVWVGEQD